MSSDTDMNADPSTPPKSDNPPCLFSVEQFQLAAQEAGSYPSSVYVVRPTAIWDTLERFKQCVIGDENCRMHDTVIVARHDLPNSPLWTAHILEIRGHRPSAQLFFRVFWFHQPSQLPPPLRHPYHGRRELIASDSMAVIDATAAAGRTHISHWHEEDEDAPATGLFWRQTYDVQAQVLSPLHAPCPPPCILHLNPDEPLISCPPPGCGARMHRSCILSATLSRVKAQGAAQADVEAASRTTKKKKAKRPKEIPSLEVKWTDDGYGALVTEVEQGGRGGHFWVEDVFCLGCGGVMR